MKLTANRQALSAALKRASRVVTIKTIPILETVRIEATQAGLEILATDMDVWLRSSVECAVSTPGICCPKLGPFAGFVAALTSEKVELEVGNDTLTVRGGSSSARFPLLLKDDFPAVSKSPNAEEFTIPANELSILIDFALPFVSKDPTRFYLNGVYLHRTEEGIAAVATDGTAMAAARLEGKFPQFPDTIIPSLTAGMMLDAEGDVTLSIDESRIALGNNGRSVISKLIDGTFPEYRRVVAPKVEKPVTVVAAEFLTAVRQIESAVDTEGLRGHRGLRLSIEGGRIGLSAGNLGSGMAEAEVKAGYAGEPTEIGFSAKYLRAAIEALGKAEEIELHIRERDVPARLCLPEVEFDHVTLLPYRI